MKNGATGNPGTATGVTACLATVLYRPPSGNAGLDRRHDRRELEAGELRRLLAVTRAGERPFRGLSGPDRFALYATACGTGFRVSALAGLTPESFDLDADPPTVTLAARRNKSRVLKVQPLPADVADLLRDYLRGKSYRTQCGSTLVTCSRSASCQRAATIRSGGSKPAGRAGISDSLSRAFAQLALRLRPEGSGCCRLTIAPPPRGEKGPAATPWICRRLRPIADS